ncbi:chitinase-3-like protein 1 [Eucyclogobius newberryi]|uniref:chitinase-3-like protein 1 n=1 Tax=Eucyclogobius newberryi TaxID=166745 RepID=UPI003B5AE73D
MAGCWGPLVLLLLVHSTTAFKLVCHFADWSQYRTGQGRFLVEDIDPFLCTHVVYDFAVIDHNNKLKVNEWVKKSSYVAFTGLKNRNSQLKTLLLVREAHAVDPQFKRTVSTAAARQTFVQSSVNFLRTHDFDGLELSWDHPGDHKYKFTQLCKDLLEAFERESAGTERTRLTLSASLTPHTEDVISLDHYEVPELTKILDFISVKAFDLSRGDVTAHHSPLYSHDNASIDFITQYLLDHEVPAEKLLLGFPAHARSYRLSTDTTRPGAPASGPANPGPFTQEMGFWANFETCAFLKGASAFWIDSQYVPYAVKHNQWVGFDNQASYGAKVSYLRSRHLGGAAVWHLDLDDFSGLFCGQGNYPLITHLKAELSRGLKATTTTEPQILKTPGSPGHTAVSPAPHSSSGTMGPGCLGNFTVVHPDPSLCTGRADGHYQMQQEPAVAYVCAKGLAYVTECPRVHSRGAPASRGGGLLLGLLLTGLLCVCR